MCVALQNSKELWAMVCNEKKNINPLTEECIVLYIYRSMPI